jgi:hypothetical protein
VAPHEADSKKDRATCGAALADVVDRRQLLFANPVGGAPAFASGASNFT